jgi:hypothetical protein
VTHEWQTIQFLRLTFASAFGLILFSESGSARPEYSLEQKSHCSACHITPYGGGQRNQFGKTFGMRGYSVTDEKLDRDLSIDARFAGYYATQETSKRSGFAVMSTVVSGVKSLEESDVPLSFVAAYDLGSLNSGLREAYAIWPLKQHQDSVSVMVGKFQAPFGLLTDEHRTYTRMLTMTSNQEFETGINLSAIAMRVFQLDLAAVNGFQSGGKYTEGDVTQGLIGNLRYNSTVLPIMLGTSYAFHQRREVEPKVLRAYSGYLGVTFKNITNGYLPLTITGEKVLASQFTDPTFNRYINRYFIPIEGFDGYMADIADKQSTAEFLQARLTISPKLALLYKYDRLLLDKEFPGDAYQRHGYGIDHRINKAINFQLRHEKAIVGREGINTANSVAARDAFIAVVHVWY